MKVPRFDCADYLLSRFGMVPYATAVIARDAILPAMDKAKILTTAKTGFMRHSWDTFVDEPPSVAQGGKGVVTGCPRCRKRLNTTDQYMRHLADDVLPKILDLVLVLADAEW